MNLPDCWHWTVTGNVFMWTSHYKKPAIVAVNCLSPVISVKWTFADNEKLQQHDVIKWESHASHVTNPITSFVDPTKCFDAHSFTDFWRDFLLSYSTSTIFAYDYYTWHRRKTLPMNLSFGLIGISQTHLAFGCAFCVANWKCWFCC